MTTPDKPGRPRRARLMQPRFRRPVGNDTVALDEVEQCVIAEPHIAHRWEHDSEPHYCMGVREVTP